MISTDVTQLVEALQTDPDARYGLRDALVESNRWDWEAVRDIVCAHPKPDGPRLLAADWFESCGDHKAAEYVRTAVELEATRASWCPNHECPSLVDLNPSRWHTGDCTCDIHIHHLRDRVRRLNLRIANTVEVTAVLKAFNDQPHRTRFQCRRGFLEDLWVTQEQWEDHGDVAVALCPILRVRIIDGWELDPPRIDRDRERKHVTITVTIAGRQLARTMSEGDAEFWLASGRLEPGRWLKLRWPGVAFYFPPTTVQRNTPETVHEASASASIHIGDLVYAGADGRVHPYCPLDGQLLGRAVGVRPGPAGVVLVTVREER